MKLSVRLVALGVSGPIAGLGVFLLIATAASIQLARTAKLELTALFGQNNRTNLLMATSLIQQDAQAKTQQISLDSEQIKADLKKLNINQQGIPQWEGRQLTTTQAQSLLGPLMIKNFSMSNQRAAVYYKSGTGDWLLLAGAKNSDDSFVFRPKPQQDLLRVGKELYIGEGKKIIPRNTMLPQQGEWRMARMTPLADDLRMALVVSTSNNAAARILQTSANLFPYKQHRLAFYSTDPKGRLICTYQRPSKDTCADLAKELKRSGGIPTTDRSKQPQISEREINPAVSVLTDGLKLEKDQPEETLFIATFPFWNLLFVIGVSDDLLANNITLIRQTTVNIVMMLIASTAILVAACGYAAWKIAMGIQSELRLLANAADALASGEKREKLIYEGNDSLGRLITAFNTMADAVFDREESLRAQIQVLEINISEQALKGQVCSITDHPGFGKLTDRARAMRERRWRLEQRRQQASDNSEGSPLPPA